MVNTSYFGAQKALAHWQGHNQIWLAGMYMHDVDCHESAILSAVNVARNLAPNAARLKQLAGVQSPAYTAGAGERPNNDAGGSGAG